jgi:hypothetical protein
MNEQTGVRQQIGKRHCKPLSGLTQRLDDTPRRVKGNAERLGGMDSADSVDNADIGEGPSNIDANSKRVR